MLVALGVATPCSSLHRNRYSIPHSNPYGLTALQRSTSSALDPAAKASQQAPPQAARALALRAFGPERSRTSDSGESGALGPKFWDAAFGGLEHCLRSLLLVLPVMRACVNGSPSGPAGGIHIQALLPPSCRAAGGYLLREAEIGKSGCTCNQIQKWDLE